MTAPATLYDADNFPEFWDRYQELHADDESRVAHLVGTAAALGMLGLAIARRSWKLALAAPMIDHAIAKLGHNAETHAESRSSWLTKPHWHLRAEWRLLRETIREYRRRARIKRHYRDVDMRDTRDEI
jgi:hypothetical protein